LVESAGLLRNIQANVLRAHGRTHSRLLFFEFTGAPARSRAFLRTCEADDWIAFAEAQPGAGAAGDAAAVLTINLSAGGLAKLALADAHRPGGDSHFEPGMHAGQEPLHLGDNLADWEPHYRDRPPDGLVLIAHDRRSVLDGLEARLRRLGADGRHAVRFRAEVENGFEWRPGGSPVVREPFGFPDCVSKLVFLREDLAALPAARAWSPMANLGQVLLNHRKPLLRGSSFMVYRKLEQDTALFADYIATHGLAAAEAAVGRTRDGRPLAQPDAGAAGNDFNYDGDRPPAAGAVARCPYQAHIRKANPRTGELRGALFVRRGAVYARRPAPGARTLAPPCGLLFIGYMRSIADQFFKMQAMWLNDCDSPGETGDNVGRDSLLFGRHRPAGAPAARPFVVPRGGGYFLVPTRDWLRAL
jgi:Dyp-type peroxidase family